jgi:hypothetical protein
VSIWCSRGRGRDKVSVAPRDVKTREAVINSIDIRTIEYSC